ncbi:hypothetical protein AK812_SmicGene46065, partial [Symbiodinium microadriaticum]
MHRLSGLSPAWTCRDPSKRSFQSLFGLWRPGALRVLGAMTLITVEKAAARRSSEAGPREEELFEALGHAAV